VSSPAADSATTGSPLRGFLAAALNLGMLSLIRLACGLVRTKFTAVAFGAAGVGLLAQGNQLFLLGVTVGSAGMSSGVIKRLAALEVDGSTQVRRDLIGTSFVIHVIASAGFTLVTLLVAQPLTGAVFGPTGALYMVVASVVAVPLNTLASGHLESVMFGIGRYELYTRAAGVATVVGLVVFLACAAAGGLEGAFWGAAVASALYFVTYVLAMRGVRPLTELLAWRFSVDAARGLLSYSLATSVTTVAGVLSLLVVRSLLVRSDGGDANGLFQVPIALTAYYTPFLTNALWARLYPRAAAGSRPAARAELAAALRVVTLGSAVAVLGILLAAELVIRVAYAEDFLPALHLLPAQLLGDVPFFALTATTIYLLATERLRAYVVTWLGFYASYVLLAALLIPRYGATGAAAAYTAAAGTVGFCAVAAVVVKDAVPGAGRLAALTTACGVAVTAMAVIVLTDKPVWWRLAVVAVTAAAAGLSLHRSRAAVTRAQLPNDV
jgi:O-antigen/teichoic acid export membrane protein